MIATSTREDARQSGPSSSLAEAGSGPEQRRCPICNSADLSIFFEMAKVPVHIGLQWPSREAARNCPRGELELVFCQQCSFIANLAYDPARLEYAREYDNTLHFSPFYQEYARSVADRLVKRYRLYGKEIIEIGCGRGEFLSLLCELGNNRGVGFDPGCDESEGDATGKGQVAFIKDFYSERYADYRGDLVCSRYVFEHVPEPVEFLAEVKRATGDRRDSIVYFEVPNVSFVLRDLSVWDLIYEHCSYFSRGSLAQAFVACGFEVVELAEGYGGQQLGIEARPGQGGCTAAERWKKADELARHVVVFAAGYERKLTAWQRRLERMQRAGRRAVLWGAGAKGVSFLNMLEAQDAVEYVVDINPRKQGKYIAGTGQEIVAPEFLREYRPEVVIVMNSIYRGEIGQMANRLGLAPAFLCA